MAEWMNGCEHVNYIFQRSNFLNGNFHSTKMKEQQPQQQRARTDYQTIKLCGIESRFSLNNGNFHYMNCADDDDEIHEYVDNGIQIRLS